MKRLQFLFVWIASILSHHSFAAEMDHLSISRAIVVESCDQNGKCNPLPLKQVTPTNVQVGLSKFYKGNATGLHGEDTLKVFAGNTPFKSKIFVNKIKSGYSLYVVLRSGLGTKRHGVTKKITVEDSSAFAPFVLIDKPISVYGKQYQAKLIVSPVLKSVSN